MTTFWILVAMLGSGQSQDSVSIRFESEAECVASLKAINSEFNDMFGRRTLIGKGKCVKVVAE